MKKAAFFFIFLGCVALCFAQSSLLEGEIRIDSDSTEFINKDNRTTFFGNVVVESRNYTINTDLMDVYFIGDTEISLIVCKKNVRFKMDNITATSDMAEIIQKSKLIKLTGNAHIIQGGNSFKSEFVTFNYETKDMFATKGERDRVIVILRPDNSTAAETK
jgi:lipopolysaccharide transport protein LptA